MRKTIFTLALAASMTVVTAVAQPRLDKDNIDEVIAAMTLEEKASLLVGGARPVMVNGIPTGTAARVSGAAGNTRPIERLGIPGTVLADGPAGLRISPVREGDSSTYYATAFPVGTSLASSWDVDLVDRVATAMGNEVLEYGVDVLLAPGMNIHRNPLCGRNFEYFSEDPLLSGRIAAAYVRGIQGNGVGVSIKHYMANNQETNRSENDARVSVRALREIYLKNFEIAVRESDPWTVMSSYNRMNGRYTQQDRDLLTTVLRDEWGFGGIVMTDWGNKAGTVDAVIAGNDLMEPGSESEIRRIVDAVNAGTLSEEYVDTNVRRMLEYIVKTPSFASYKYSDKPDLKAHAKIAREAGAESVVLLENRGALPLEADCSVALFGVSSYEFISGGTGSGDVNEEYTRNLKEGLEELGVTVEPKLASWYGSYISYSNETLENTRGLDWFWGKPVLKEMEIPESFVAAEEARTDLAIVTIGRNSGEGADRTGGEGDFRLNPEERMLLETVCDAYHQAGKKVIVVLNVGGVIETASWKDLPDAVLLAWQPGMEGGAAVADVLCGRTNPSGKLPMTFPIALFDNPSTVNFPYSDRVKSSGNMRSRAPRKNVDYTEYQEGIYVGYRYFETEGVDVSYPFGYGLSYTSFSYSEPVVKPGKDGFTAYVKVTNTGKLPGKEAVQLYLSAPDGSVDKPAVELKGFAKSRLLAPGESQVLAITVDNYSLASFHEDASSWVADSGTYRVCFSANVRDVRAESVYRLKKTLSWPVHDVLSPDRDRKE